MVAKSRTTGMPAEPTKAPPACPAFLSDDARLIWEELVPDLAKHSLINAADTHALAAYCETYSQYQECVRMIQTEGQITQVVGGTGRKAHPATTVQNNLLKHILSFSKEFGFCPGARKRLHIKSDTTENEDDELDGFIR
jgi:P27 family predicted phage terminase small subunit